MSEVCDVTAVVANARRGANREACQATRRVAVRAVILTQRLVSAHERCILVVGTLNVGCSRIRATRAGPNNRGSPRACLGSVVCLAPSVARKVECWGRVARWWIPPTWVEDAFECTIRRAVGHWLHTEASAGACQRWLCSGWRKPLPPRQGDAVRIVTRTRAMDFIM